MTAERKIQTTGIPGMSDAEFERLAVRTIRVLLSVPDTRRDALEKRLDLLCDAFLSDREETRHGIFARLRRDGIDADAIVDRVLPEVARNAGRRWMEDEISFADVTIVTARLQETVRSLGGGTRTTDAAEADGDQPDTGARPRVLLIIPRPEQHTMGTFVAADQLRRRGYEVDVAMDLHPRQIGAKVRKTRYCMIGISASGRRTLASAMDLVNTIRASVTRVTPIVLGGSIVAGGSRLRDLTGVDHVAGDVDAALRACGLPSETGESAHAAS